MSELIEWKEVRDRHQEGHTSIGRVWIRLGRDGKVASWYTCFNGKTDKWFAENEDTIDLIRQILQEELNRYHFSNILALKNK